MTEKTKLAVALGAMASSSAGLESKADGVLLIVRRSNIADEKAFSIAIRDAYAQNGWNAGAGKPKEGSVAAAVPPTVKQYVSQIRRAFRLRVDLAKCRNFYEMRKAVRKSMARKSAANAVPALRGIRLINRDEMLGDAPLHDLAVLLEKASETRQKQITAEVNRLLKQYMLPELRIAA